MERIELPIQIREFFNAYEENFNRALSGDDKNLETHLAKSFADCFVAASPMGIQCGKRGDEFLENIRQGIHFYRSIGSESMHIRQLDTIVLNGIHFLVQVEWRYTYNHNNKNGIIDFQVHYLVRCGQDGVQIFGYVTGDEQKALMEHGLIPET